MHQLIRSTVFTAIFALVTFIAVPAQAAAVLASTYTATGDSVTVTVVNNGPDDLYNVSLQPSGAGIDTQFGAIYVGNIAAGATATFQISSSSPQGYIVLSGNATDVAGQSVHISVVSEGK